MVETIIKNEELTEVNEKAYTLKKLSAANVFTFTTILNKIGFKEIKECFQSEEMKELVKKGNKVDVESIGIQVMMDVVSIVLANLENCKDSIYQLLSDLSGMSKEEINELDMNVFIEMIIDVFKKDEFKDFFKVVSKLLK